MRVIYVLNADAMLNHRGACRDRSEWLYLRVERQVTSPLGDSFLFTIRTHLYDCAQLSADELLRLQASVDSMDDLTRAYKGVTAKARQNLDALIRR